MSLTQSIKVDGDTTSFNRQIAKTAEYTQKAFKAVGKELGDRIGSALTVSALIDRVLDFSRSIIEAADNVGDLSDSLELSVEEVQKLGVAAQLAGTKFGRVERVMRTIQALRDQALAGDEKAKKTFETLGVNPMGKSPLEIVRQMVSAGEKSMAAQNAIADTFKANLTTIKNVLEKLDTMGPVDVFTQDQVDKLGAASDAYNEMARVIKVSFAPALIFAMNTITNLVMGVKTVFEELANFLYGDFSALNASDPAKRNQMRNAGLNVLTAGTIGALDPEKYGLTPKAMTRATEGSAPGIAAPSAETLKPTAAALGIKGDTLSRIGLFVGGSGVGDRLVTIGSYQLTQLRGIREEMRKLNEG